MKLIRPYDIVDATLTSCNVPETDYAAYNPATTYSLGDRVIVVGANIHKIYESLQAANTGHTPATEPTWWLDCGATNKWKMFDHLVNNQTEYTGNMQFTLTCVGRINAIAFLNVYASSIRVIATDAIDGVVFDRTTNMQSNMGIVDWWSWFFEYPTWNSTLVITDLPIYSDLVFSITITGIGGISKCGECIIGLSKELGDTLYGATVGIQDYSVKTRDTWGNYTIQERAYSKRANFTLDVPNGAIDNLEITLAGYRATPILYVGANQYGSTAILGFYKDFSINIAYFSFSTCSIEIEGII